MSLLNEKKLIYVLKARRSSEDDSAPVASQY
jgi:hypothetical protein